MSKVIVFDTEAREKLKEGVDLLARCVTTTLGPLGYNVALDDKFSTPNITHDGVTVAEKIDTEDPFVNAGIKLIKNVALDTNDRVGDGTTTSIVIAQSIIKDGFEAIEEGSNPMRLRKGIEEAGKKVVAGLKEQSKPISTHEERLHVSNISSQDENIGRIVVDAIEQVGDRGVVVIEEGNEFTHKIELKKGMQFDRGYASSFFQTSEDGCEIENPYVLVTDQRITSFAQLQSLLQEFSQVDKNLVIIADSVEGDALANLIMYRQRGVFDLVAINAPYAGEKKRDFLQDMCVLSGATLLSLPTHKLSSAKVEHLGKIKNIKTNSSSTVVTALSDNTKLDEHIKYIEAKLKSVEGDYNKEVLKERIAKLSGGIAFVKIGATSESELKEKKERAIDAKSAVQAGIEEGIIAGGGVSLYKLSDLPTTFTGDEKKGFEILLKACKQPFLKLIENAGLDILETINKAKTFKKDEGIDVMDGKVKDLIKEGIIDPVKVTRTALENASSIASIILTTKVLVTDKLEKKDK